MLLALLGAEICVRVLTSGVYRKCSVRSAVCACTESVILDRGRELVSIDIVAGALR